MNNRTKLTLTQFLDTIDVDDGRVHTFVNAPLGILLGADWDLKDAKDLARAHGAELAGEGARAMRHGVCVQGPERTVFFATREETNWEALESGAVQRRKVAP